MRKPEHSPAADAEELLRQGQHAAALQRAEHQLRTAPGESRLHRVRVNAGNALGDQAAVIDSLQQLLRLHPGHAQYTRMLATAINNRGSRTRGAGDLAAAQADFEQATALLPDHAQAWFNLAVVLRERGQRDAALFALRRHLGVQPDDLAGQWLLASLSPPHATLTWLQQLDAATLARLDPGWLAQGAVRAGLLDTAVQAVTRLRPEHDLGAAIEAVAELHLRGEAESTRAAAADVTRMCLQTATPSLRAQLVAELSLPAVYPDAAAIELWRDRFSLGLQRLDDDWQPALLRRCGRSLRQLLHSNFLLAYQGGNDRDLQSAFASLIERAATALQPSLCTPLPARRSGRIGLLSAGWRNCTVGAYFGGWIDWLRDAGYPLYLYQLGPQRDSTTDHLACRATVFRYLEQAPEQIAEIVRGDDLDLLIYPEIGMDARMTPLAALRLARRQAVAWGHPVSSGFSRIDDFLSCALMEPANAGQHYREQLQTLPGLGVDYRQPPIPPVLPADQLGLNATRPRVLVPQSLFKLHPDCDQVLVDIASQRPDVQLILFDAEYPQWKTRYRQRLQAGFAARGLDAERHLCFLPLTSRERYLQINQACDLMLDSLHWSGGNTALDALSCGLPLVACPGQQMRGRQSAAMLQLLDLNSELQCATPSAQADRVVGLLADVAQLGGLRSTIRTRLPQLFDPQPARRVFLDWIAVTIEHAGG